MDNDVLVQYKNKLVEVMKSFDRFCTDNQLQYFASSGTAIGAIRHKGFIPWDDDIDVYMPRADYNRLMQLRKTLSGSGYAIKDLGDNEYVYAFAKYYDANTTLIETKEFPKCIIGVYIDIFPLDEVFGSYEEISRKKTEYSAAYRMYQDTFIKVTPRMFLSYFYHRNFKRFLELFRAVFFTEKKKADIRSKFCQLEKQWSKEHGRLLLTHSCIYPLERELFQKEWFSDYVYLPFENIEIRLPKEYDHYLTHLFGDYMTPPPAEKQVSTHSHYYLNFREQLSYREIKKRLSIGETLVL